MPKSLTEKLVVSALAASLAAAVLVPVIGVLQSCIRREHPIIRKYEGVYGQVRSISKELEL